MDETKRQPYGDEGWFAFITFLHCQYLVFNIGWIIFYAAFGLLSPPSLLPIAIYAIYEITLIVMYFKRLLGTRLPAGDHSLGELREQIEQENIQAALSDPFIAEICAYDFDSAYRAWLSYYGLTSEDYYNLDYYGYFKKLWDAVNGE